MAVVVCSGSRGTSGGDIGANANGSGIIGGSRGTNRFGSSGFQAEEGILWRFTKRFNLC